MNLYHATYNYYLNSIFKYGLNSRYGNRNWEDSKDDVIYLAKDPNEAYDFAETADENDEEIYDSGIVVLLIKIPDLTLLKKDANVSEDYDTYEYHGNIPIKYISIYNENKQNIIIEFKKFKENKENE